MNRYTIQVKPGDGSEPYFLEMCAVDQDMIHRFMSDAAMQQYVGAGATLNIVYILPWF